MTTTSERLASLLDRVSPPTVSRKGDNGPKPAPVVHATLLIAELTGYIVYELYDADNQILYVGQTQDLPSRLGQHFDDLRFGPLIHHVNYHQYATHQAMCNAEAQLIQGLTPPHNIIGITRHSHSTLPPRTANLKHSQETAKDLPKGLGISEPNLAQAVPTGRETPANGHQTAPKDLNSTGGQA